MSRPLCVVVLLVLFAGRMAAGAAADDRPSPQIRVPDRPAPILPLDDVRVGMKGYGLTVLAGDTIEPFPVEVLSIVRSSSPQRAVIWVRCTDPRLIESGPVQGMSGSPIYLWADDEPRELGEGGRLIGAFAFGYGGSLQCLAGVQPIEQMRPIAGRAIERTAEDPPGEARGPGASPRRMAEVLERLERVATARGAAAIGVQRVAVAKRILTDHARRRGNADGAAMPQATAEAVATVPGRAGRTVEPMALPMSVGSSALAEWFAPVLEPLGVAPRAGGGELVGAMPPSSVDADRVALEPGSVLAVPLAFGDVTLAATGTVTDVLPDGSVLGFGHAFFSEGDAALPMATGYTHFLVPLRSMSFKLSDTLAVQGTLLRDESGGVAGTAGQRFETSPMSIRVALPGMPEKSYRYQIVHEPSMSSTIAAILAIRSITAEQGLPMHNTMRVQGRVAMSGGHEVAIDSTYADAGGFEIVFDLMPLISTLMNNPFEPLKIESVELDATVEAESAAAVLTDARLDHAIVAPGQELGVTLEIRPYEKPVDRHRLSIRIPPDTPEGDYELVLTDPNGYLSLTFANRPYLFLTEDVEDVVDLMRRMQSIETTRMYAVLQVQRQGVAIGREAMPRLPSSRAAILAAPVSSAATPFMETLEASVDTGYVPQGQWSFLVSVRKDRRVQVTPAEQASNGRP